MVRTEQDDVQVVQPDSSASHLDDTAEIVVEDIPETLRYDEIPEVSRTRENIESDSDSDTDEEDITAAHRNIDVQVMVETEQDRINKRREQLDASIDTFMEELEGNGATEDQNETHEPPKWGGDVLKIAQNSYRPIRVIRERLLETRTKMTNEEMRDYDTHARELFSYWRQYEVINGCLYRIKDKTALAVLPPETRGKMFKQLHNSPYGGGHMRMKKTVAKFNERA
jgi:hypothetical protein